MTPEDWLLQAQRVMGDEQWDRATAYACAGLLSLAIGAMKAVSKLGEPKDG